MKQFLLLLALLTVQANAQIKYSPLYKHNTEDKKMAKIAERLTNEMIQSEAFRKFMVERGLTKTNGRTSEEVVKHLKSINGSVRVKMYYSPKNVVGFRQPPSKDINTNSKFHRGANGCAKASNMAHEGMGHSLGGYGHSYKAHKNRVYSVPYSINAAFKSLCSCTGKYDCKILEVARVIKYKTVCKRTWYTAWIGKKCYKVEVK